MHPVVLAAETDPYRVTLFYGCKLNRVLPSAVMKLCLITESFILETVIICDHQPRGLEQCLFNL